MLNSSSNNMSLSSKNEKESNLDRYYYLDERGFVCMVLAKDMYEASKLILAQRENS